MPSFCRNSNRESTLGCGLPGAWFGPPFADIVVCKTEHEEVAHDPPGTAMLLDCFAFQCFFLSPSHHNMHEGFLRNQKSPSTGAD